MDRREANSVLECLQEEVCIYPLVDAGKMLKFDTWGVFLGVTSLGVTMVDFGKLQRGNCHGSVLERRTRCTGASDSW